MLGDLVDIYVMVYLDNFLIYFAIVKDYTRHLKAVFKWLDKSKFYLNSRKYTLLLPEVEFLVYMVSELSVLMLPVKVSAK